MSDRDNRRTLGRMLAVGAGVVGVLAIAACGTGTGGAPNTAQDGRSASANATTAAAPAVTPDPCGLLTAEAAATLGGVAKLEASPASPDGFEKACEWGNGSANGVVRLAISRLYPPSADDLARWQQNRLELEEGDPVTGVGDAAKMYLTAPSRIVVTAGYFVFRIDSYKGDMSVTTLLPGAAKQVVAALPA